MSSTYPHVRPEKEMILKPLVYQIGATRENLIKRIEQEIWE